MADYFEEMGWRPLREGETPNHLLHFARLLLEFGMFEALGEGERVPPPASKDFVKNLPRLQVDIPESQCRICLKEYESNETAIKLPCQHIFHDGCILPWLEKTNTCPLCRHEMPTDDEDYELYRKEKIRAKEREKDIETLHNSMFS